MRNLFTVVPRLVALALHVAIPPVLVYVAVVGIFGFRGMLALFHMPVSGDYAAAIGLLYFCFVFIPMVAWMAVARLAIFNGPKERKPDLDEPEGKNAGAGLDARQSMEHNARLLRWMPLSIAVIHVVLHGDGSLLSLCFATTMAVLLAASLTAHAILVRHRLAEKAQGPSPSNDARLDWCMLASAFAMFLTGSGFLIKCTIST